MKMQRSALIRSLLVQNIALSREMQHLYAYLSFLEGDLSLLEREGREFGRISPEGIGEIRANLRMVCDAVEKRQVRDTGRTDHPTAEEMGKIAKADDGIETAYFKVLDEKAMGSILDTIFKDIDRLLDHKKDEGGDPKPEIHEKFYFFPPNFFPPKKRPENSLGGDLEGEWEDYRDDDPDFPQNPFAGSD